MLGFRKATPQAMQARARQFHLRADQLDREGKHTRAIAERLHAEKYEKAATKIGAR